MPVTEPHQTNEPGFEPLSIFAGFGLELEYMLVDHDTLDVMPVCDRVLQAQAGEPCDDVFFPDITWSNELMLHVLEFKTTNPVTDFSSVPGRMLEHVKMAQVHAEKQGAILLPGGVHPWMDPVAEARLWPHANREIYSKFDEIFSCQGHGWANLQSAHLNLPFADDEQFGRLHAAIRLVLPLLPAIAASSPIIDGQLSPYLDARLHAYRHHGDAVPSIVGNVIPEPIYTIESYHRLLLDRLYADVAGQDPSGILRHEWLNARGAIARFVRNTIEIRVIDVQECPLADVTVACMILAVLRSLVDEAFNSLEAQQAMPTAPLKAIFDQAVRDGERAVVTDRDYLALLDFHGPSPVTLGDLWRDLLDRAAETGWPVDRFVPASPTGEQVARTAEFLLDHGPLARRLRQALRVDSQTPGTTLDRSQLQAVYRKLATCLQHGQLFHA